VSKWGNISGKVISCRVSEGVYTLLKGTAESKGLSLGVYISQVLTLGANKINGSKQDNPQVYTPTIPVYNSGIHKSGDRVMIRQGRKMVESVVPEIDVDGNVIY